jgi:hypothetical protein
VRIQNRKVGIIDLKEKWRENDTHPISGFEDELRLSEFIIFGSSDIISVMTPLPDRSPILLA